MYTLIHSLFKILCNREIPRWVNRLATIGEHVPFVANCFNPLSSDDVSPSVENGEDKKDEDKKNEDKKNEDKKDEDKNDEDKKDEDKKNEDKKDEDEDKKDEDKKDEDK